MAAEIADLPTFERPPLVEVVCGVRFRGLRGLGIVHYGRFASRHRDRFPNVAERPIAPPPSLGRAGFSVPSIYVGAHTRLALATDGGDRLLQFQPDGLFHNWQRTESRPEYPRYRAVRDAFLVEWSDLNAFVQEEDLGSMAPFACELAYVNLVPQGELWNRPEDVGHFLRLAVPDAAGIEEAGVGRPEVLQAVLQAPVPGIRGVLAVALHLARRSTDQAEVFRIELTAHGEPTGGGDGDLQVWFDEAHRVVVRAFDRLTTERAHRAWHRASPPGGSA